MSTLKMFECMLFRPEGDCPYTVTGEEGEVVSLAAIHEQVEHGIEDTPKTRQKIKDSLVDVDNTTTV